MIQDSANIRFYFYFICQISSKWRKSIGILTIQSEIYFWLLKLVQNYAENLFLWYIWLYLMLSWILPDWIILSLIVKFYDAIKSKFSEHYVLISKKFWLIEAFKCFIIFTYLFDLIWLNVEKSILIWKFWIGLLE